MIGTTAVVVGFLLVVGSGIRAALRARSEFSKLVALGLTVDTRLPVVFHHGRGHPPAPAHRRHAALRRLRRFVAARELRPRRLDGADLGRRGRPRPACRWRAGHGRSRCSPAAPLAARQEPARDDEPGTDTTGRLAPFAGRTVTATTRSARPLDLARGGYEAGDGARR